MNNDDLVRSLTWFHMLEINQVNLYNAQAVQTDSEVDRRMFLKVAEIESQHIDNTYEALRSIGGSPSAFASVAPITGTILGTIIGIALPVTLKSNIIIENRAMEDYQRLISKCDNEYILEVLWSNYLDESLHTEWFKARLNNDADKLPSMNEALSLDNILHLLKPETQDRKH